MGGIAPDEVATQWSEGDIESPRHAADLLDPAASGVHEDGSPDRLRVRFNIKTVPIWMDGLCLASKLQDRPVKTGFFREMMEVELVNDGPATFILER